MTLSDKIARQNAIKEFGGMNLNEWLRAEDVKEFIKLILQDCDTFIRTEDVKLMIKHRAGNKLI